MVTHAQIENEQPNVINSYRWQRGGMKITLNVRTDNMHIGGASGIDVRGARMLNYKVGFNPDEARKAIDLHHRASKDYRKPPRACNPHLRKVERMREENKKEVERLRRQLNGPVSLRKALWYNVKYCVKRLLKWNPK